MLANGDPAQPQFNGSGALTSLTDVAAASGGSVTYSFTAANPGTYLYESGTEPEIQVRMGLFGALIVRPSAVPAGGADPDPSHYAYDRADSQFNPNTEFLELLSEIDTNLNRAMELQPALRHPDLPSTLLAHQRARLPRQRRRQRRLVAAYAAIRLARRDPTVRRDYQSRARPSRAT